MVSAALLSMLPALPHAPAIRIDARPATSAPWLDRFNLWRASTGVGAVVEDPTFSAGDYAHAQYMVLNDLVTHYETPGTPYYTVAGDTAARNSNIYVSSSTSTADTSAIDWWMGAPFHSMGMMDPRLSTTGFGSYRATKSGWQMGAAVNVVQGNSFSGGQFPVYFPGNGTSEPLTSYSGNEWPDPLQACSGYAMPTGLPIWIETGGNIATTAGPVHTLTANGVSLANCVIDSTNATLGSYLTERGGVIMIPRQPLQSGVTYTVALTVNGVPYTWSFTVGPFQICTVSASATPTGHQSAGANVVLTSSATGCPNPQFEIWVRAANAPCCQLLQSYASNATYTWSTAGLSVGTYYFSVWAKDAGSSGAYSNSLGRYDAAYVFSYTLTGTATPCSGVTASASPASPQLSGTAITITGAATGCPNPLYEFFVLYPNSQTWLVAQYYSTNATYSWKSSSLPAGVYTYQVWVRDASSVGVTQTALGGWDAYTPLQYQLTSTCTSVSASSAPSGTATVGTQVVITGTASSCSHPLYEFFVLYPGSQTWLVAQYYSTSPSYTWSTSGKPKGTYQYQIWVRDATSPGSTSTPLGRWDAYAPLAYTLI